MERRAASHTEEEEMNTRRRLLNAARKGDAKAIGKLFELYQVRVLSGDQLAKVNKTSTYMVPVKPSKSGKSSSKRGGKPTKMASTPPAKTHMKPAKPAARPPAKPKAKHK
jgi:hypothetical protein